MSSSMAEVLAEHRFLYGQRYGVERVEHCSCGWQTNSGTRAWEAIAAHQAEVLAANGYGKLEDAWDALTANSPRLPSDVRNAVFELVFDVANKFHFPMQNCGLRRDVVEAGDVCGDVERRIVALLRARAATERGEG